MNGKNETKYLLMHINAYLCKYKMYKYECSDRK